MKRDDWTTPQKLFNYCNEIYKFNIDAAASSKNTKCKYYFDKSVNFLSYCDEVVRIKNASIWCNPPYSLDQNFAEMCKGIYVAYGIPSVLLLPVRSDRVWYQELAHSMHVNTVPLTGRVHFGGSGKGAFMYSILFIIGHKDKISGIPQWLDAGQFNAKGRGSATT